MKYIKLEEYTEKGAKYFEEYGLYPSISPIYVNVAHIVAWYPVETDGGYIFSKVLLSTSHTDEINILQSPVDIAMAIDLANDEHR